MRRAERLESVVFLSLVIMATNTCTEIYSEQQQQSGPQEDLKLENKQQPFSRKPKLPITYDTYVITQGGKKITTFRLPTQDNGEVIELPATERQWKLIFGEYVKKSPYFKLKLKEYEAYTNYLELVNKYLSTSQYKKGTPKYYENQVFGTRRRRDQFVDFMESNLEVQYFKNQDISNKISELNLAAATILGDQQDVRVKAESGETDPPKQKPYISPFYFSFDYMLEKAREDEQFRWFMDGQHYYEYHQEAEYMEDIWHEYWIMSCRGPSYKPKYVITAEAGINQTETLTQEENTTFTDQRDTIVDTGYITTQTMPNLQSVSMPESEWHVRNIMSKPIPFWNGDWNVSDTLGKNIKTWDIPGEALFGPHYNLLSTFTFFRGHPRIRFQINGTKFHSGRVIAAFIPVYDGTLEDSLYPVSNLVSLPHVILDASLANSGIIDLPFVHMNSYFNTAAAVRPWQSLGRLQLTVFNKLRASDTASQSIGITAWISYDNCELHQPCFAHKPALPSAPKMTQVKAESGVEGLMKSVVPMLTDMVAPELGAVTGLLGNVSGGAANQDKPTDPVEIQRWVPNGVTGLSQGDGIDRSSRLCLAAGSYTVPDADLISTTNDDMNLLELCKIPCRFDLFDWKSTQGTGTRLAHFPVCPNLFTGYTTDDTTKPAVEVISPTLLAYISRYFKFWRGAHRFKVQIIASQMHTGRLMVSFGAGINLSNSSQFGPASYLNTYVIDLQEKHEVEFTVPFFCERPWLRCDRFRKYDETGAAEIDQFNYENLGYIDIYVLNRLAHPESVSASVAVNVFVSAGDDFELAFPSELDSFQGIGNVIKKPEKAVAESLITQEGVTTREQSGPVTLGKGNGYIKSAGKTTMGEDAMDLKKLLRRYTKVYFNNRVQVGDAANYLAFNNTPTLSSVNKAFSDYGTQCRTALSHFSELFTFWRGSLRYKLVYQVGSSSDELNTQKNITLKIFHVPGVFTRGTFTPTRLSEDEAAMYAAFESQGVTVGVTNVQGSLEFEVPFYTPYTQLKCLTTGIHNSRTSTGRVFIIMQTPVQSAGTYMTFDLYQAAGDDFTLNYLRAAPRVQFIKAYDTTRNLEDNATFIHDSIPPIRTGMKFTEGKPEKITAEALSDWVPGMSQVKSVTQKVEAASIKVDTVCDTANHLLQQATKKLGLGSDDEEEEEKVTTVFEDASRLCNPILVAVEAALSYIQHVPGKLSEYLKPYRNITDIVIEVSNLVSGLSAYFGSDSIVVKTCAIVTIVTTLLKECHVQFKNTLFAIVTDVFLIMNDTKKGNEVSKAEAFSFDLVAPLTATLTVALGALAFKKIPTDKETTEMCKALSEKLRLFNFSSTALTNIKGLWTEMKELIQWCIDYVLNLVSPQLLAQIKLEREFEDIEEWAKFIDSLENIQYADKIHYDGEFKKKLFRAVDTGKRYNTLLLEGKCGRAASVVREYVRKITEIGLHCERSKNELPFRKDPFSIFMFGATDIGKSGCITTVGFDIMDELGYPRHNRWCAINCTEKFFSENYRQQTGVYFDDFSTFTSEEQYQKFFNLKANTAFPLDMAFRKGEYFNSDFIFGTTNSPYPKPNFVTNHDALLRRRDMLIEADWCDDADVQEALREKKSMAPYRKLDNSHLKFRLRNPRDERDPPGAWMPYSELIIECTVSAQDHLNRQQAKLTYDLERAGYILPEAEAGSEEIKVQTSTPPRRLIPVACINSPHLSMFNPDLWKHLKWIGGVFVCTVDDDEIQQEWEDVKAFFEATQVDLQETLRKHSAVERKNPSMITRIKGKLSEFKKYCQEKVSEIIGEHTWIRTIGQWALYLAGAIAAVGAIYFGAQQVIHKCACAAIRYYGFRCGFCGKWPALKNVFPRMKNWMLEQWSSLYGCQPYTDGHITTTEEESALRSVQKRVRCELTEPFMATKIHAEAVYNDVTKGQKIMKISAQQGPYTQDVKGAQVSKISAQHADELDQEVPKTRLTAESENIDALIQNRIFPYLYRIRTYGSVKASSKSVNGYAIGDRYLLINKHLFYGMEEGELFEVFHNGAWMPIEFLQSSTTTVPNKDLVIYKMPVTFHAHKSNVHHFISEKELAYYQAGRGALCKLDSSLQNILVENLRIKAVKEIKFELENKGENVPLYVQKAWSYDKCSSGGDCGSVLVAYTDKIAGKILGIHIASSPSISYSQLITKEMLEPLVKRLNGTPQPQAEAKLGNLIPQGHLGRIGKAPPGKGFYQSPKTEIIPTEIQGLISEPVTGPSVLSINDERLTKRVNPLRLGIEKYSFCSMPFPVKHRQIVNDSMKDELRSMVRTREPKPLTLEESVLGIPELEGYERLPKSTSPGYPWILTRPSGAHGKDYLFDEESGLPLYDLKEAVTYREEQAKKLERIVSVWVDCKKDERRTFDKIKKGSTRIFTIPPVDYSLLMRKYTLDFCVAVKDSRAFMDCKVGIDPQSMEWTTLYYWLSEFSNICVAGDFSRFDGSMPAELIDDVREDIDFYYETFGQCSEEDKNVRRILFDELIHTIHLAQDEFYMTHIGNKSGNPITVILNSRINSRYMKLAWLGLCEKMNKMDYFSMAKFKQFVRMANYGDDNILAIKDEVMEWYNQETISEYLSEFKITYTNEEKTGITKFKPLDECSFLKQTFRNHETLNLIKVPHMKQATILELLNWTRVAPDQDVLLQDNINDALRFAYFYGEKYFNQLRQKILDALDVVNKRWLPSTYMDFHLWFLGVIKVAN